MLALSLAVISMMTGAFGWADRDAILSKIVSRSSLAPYFSILRNNVLNPRE